MYFLEANNESIGQDLVKPNFLYKKCKNSYTRYTRVGKLFYEHRMLVNVVKCMMLEHRADATYKNDVGDATLFVCFTL